MCIVCEGAACDFAMLSCSGTTSLEVGRRLPTSAQKQQFLMALAEPLCLSALGALSWDASAEKVPLPGSSNSCLPDFWRVRLVRTRAMCW